LKKFNNYVNKIAKEENGMICNLCPRKCLKNRDENVGDGVCLMPNKIKIAHYELFMFEEPCISFGKGSGAIFFSGCNLKCLFCQNYEISTNMKGKFISAEELANIFKELEEKGAENINLVTPTHYSHLIIKALQIYKPKVPVIYNTNGYEKEEIIEEVAKYVDIFLPDFKYYSSELSKKLSSCEDYFSVCLKAIKKMRSLKEDVFDENGKMLSGVLIRHMILPLCTNDSIKILNVIKDEIPHTKVSLMGQYVPLGRAKECAFINRKITKKEYDKVLDEFMKLKLDGFIQELNSASESYVPNFKFI